MSTTLKDIARKLGVSTSTISKALNEKPGVSEDLRKKILEAVEGQQLRPKAKAAAAAKEKGVNIVLLVRINQTVVADPFYALITEGISTGLQTHRFNLLYYVMHEKTLDETAFMEMFEANEAGGAILVGADFSTELLERIARLDIPVVMVDNRYNGFGSVNTDNYAGAVEAVRHLTQSGHRQLIFLSGPLQHQSIRQRYKGFCDVLAETPGVGEPVLIECDGVSVDDGYNAIISCGKIDFTAVFAANDKLAIGAIKALKERGFLVPQNISVVGFDDIEWGLHTEPPLTTVRIAKHQLGALAAQLLLHLTGDNAEAHAVDITVAAKLIRRGSTAPIG